MEEETEERIPEKIIRCVWNDQLIEAMSLKLPTVNARWKLSSPGYWNFGSGPDFKSAAIRVDGTLHEGDVELHVYGCDWKTHGHSDNQEYDDVILHVFMWKGRGSKPIQKESSPPAKNLSRPHIIELELKNYSLKQGLLQLNEQLDFDSYPLLNQFNTGLCHKPLDAVCRRKNLRSC